MKTTVIYIAIITITFSVAFLFSALLTLPWIMAHWSREVLVLLLIVMVLCLGGLTFLQKAKQ